MDNEFIEQFISQHWPPHESIHYDGWRLAFSEGYTKRANSITIMDEGTIPVEQKINECEKLYSKRHLSTIFQLFSYNQSQHLDFILAQRGYVKQSESLALTMKLEHILDHAYAKRNQMSVDINNSPSEEWLQFQFSRKNLNFIEQAAYLNIISKLTCKTAYFSIKKDGQIVAACFCVVDNNYASIYSLLSDSLHRNKGYATTLLYTFFNWAKQNGAQASYILVEANNNNALRLYTKIGYREQFSYWYRVKSNAE